jgi:nitrite reductase (NADH) large subunit
MYYLRTADRLQRTARWIEELDGGLDHVRSVVVDDALGIGAELEAAMALHVDNYEDEWAATLRDPERLKRFRSFVNAPGDAAPGIPRVIERGQARPATAAELASGVGGAVRAGGAGGAGVGVGREAGEADADGGRVLLAGARIPVRGGDDD